MSIESVMPSNHLILCHFLLFLLSIIPSFSIFSNGSVLGGQSIGASDSASVLAMNIQGWNPLWLTGFVLGTLKSLLQHHSLKASILWSSAFFIVQLSHPYMITKKTIVLTRWTFVSTVMSLLSDTLSMFFIAFLPRSKHLLIPWLQSPSAVILESKKVKSVSLFPLFTLLFVVKKWDQMSWS